MNDPPHYIATVISSICKKLITLTGLHLWCVLESPTHVSHFTFDGTIKTFESRCHVRARVKVFSEVTRGNFYVEIILQYCYSLPYSTASI